MSDLTPIAVLGGGSWGTALAILLASTGREVALWARNAEHRSEMEKDHRNARYLPKHAFPPSLTVRADSSIESLAQSHEVFLLVVPSHAFRTTAQQLSSALQAAGKLSLSAGTAPPIQISILWGTKGFDPSSGELLSKVVYDELGASVNAAIISGPSFAAETAGGLPTALTAAELINMGRYAWSGLLGRSSKADKQAVAEAFARTHTEKFADQIVDTLSGGERSRIWLAMCLAQQSRFLLLDEPLAALDIAHQLEVMALIRDLSHRLHLGVIIVIHDINLAAQYCDELVALKQGRLLKQGKPAEIMTAKVVDDIYSVQMNIIRHPQTGVPVALP